MIRCDITGTLACVSLPCRPADLPHDIGHRDDGGTARPGYLSGRLLRPLHPLARGTLLGIGSLGRCVATRLIEVPPGSNVRRSMRMALSCEYDYPAGFCRGGTRVSPCSRRGSVPSSRWRGRWGRSVAFGARRSGDPAIIPASRRSRSKEK